MKATQTITLRTKSLMSILMLSIIILLNSCAKKVNFLTSTVVPAARGHVKIKKDNNNNYAIKIRISNLAEVSRLEPTRQSYVLWMITDEGKTKNIGRLKSSTKFLSKKLKASLETVSSFKPNQIFMTAEPNENVQSPDQQIVLSTRKF